MLSLLFDKLYTIGLLILAVVNYSIKHIIQSYLFNSII